MICSYCNECSNGFVQRRILRGKNDKKRAAVIAHSIVSYCNSMSNSN